MILSGRRGTDPYKTKSKYSQQKKQKKYVLHPVSACTGFTPALHFQRACRQCVHESARLFRVLCSHAWYSQNCGEQENRQFSLCPYRTHSPRMARANDSCTRREFFKRGNEPMHAVRWLASPRQGESPLK